MLEYHEENNVSVSLVFLKKTKSQILDKVIVSHIVYVVQFTQSVEVSNVTDVGLPNFFSCTVLLAVLAVKHKYGIGSSTRKYTHILFHGQIN